MQLRWWRETPNPPREHQNAGGDQPDSAAAVPKAVRRELNRLRGEVAQHEALANLYAILQPKQRIPPRVAWAAPPDLLLVLVDLIRQRPGLVLECGSGWSTMWLGLACRRFGGQIVSLEHNRKYVEQTQRMLDACELGDSAEVRHAELSPIVFEGVQWLWYDHRSWQDLDGICLLFVDGPPKKTQPLARYPALPLLRDQLGANFAVGMDNQRRRDEREIVHRWKQIPGLQALDLPLAEPQALLYGGAPPTLYVPSS